VILTARRSRLAAPLENSCCAAQKTFQLMSATIAAGWWDDSSFDELTCSFKKLGFQMPKKGDLKAYQKCRQLDGFTLANTTV
jgi:hypothetical protein